VRARVATMLRELAIGPSGPPVIVPATPPAAPEAAPGGAARRAVNAGSPHVRDGGGDAGHHPAADDSACGHTSSLH